MKKVPYIRKVGLIGDVHAEADLLEAVIQFLKRKDVDTLLCMGDLTDGWGDLERCLNLLQSENVYTVLGNHDRWCIAGELRNRPECHLFEDLSPRSQQFLRQLPVTQAFRTPRGRALMCHGVGHNDMGKIPPSDRPIPFSSRIELQQATAHGHYAFLLNGHSHRRMLRSIGKVTVINAGTLMHRHGAGFVLMDFESGLGQAYDVTLTESSQQERPDIRITRAEPLLLPQEAIAAS